MLRDTSSLSHSGIVSSSEVNGNSEELPEGTVISVGVVSLYLFSYPARRCPVLTVQPIIQYSILYHTAHNIAQNIAHHHYIQYNIPQDATEKGMIGTD